MTPPKTAAPSRRSKAPSPLESEGDVHRRRAGAAMPRSVGEGGSVRKICAVLRALGSGGELRLTDIAERAGLNKVSALRILRMLGEEQFVRRVGDRGYALGLEALLLGAVAGREQRIREVAQPHLMRVAAEAGDTAIFSVRSGHEAICLDRLSGWYPIQATFTQVGTRLPLGTGTAGVVILAAMPSEAVGPILDLVETLLDPYPNVTRALIEQDIEVARRQGYFLTHDRLVPRMAGLAAPVVTPDGDVIGALSIGALDERVLSRLDTLVPLITREAQILGEALGGAG